MADGTARTSGDDNAGKARSKRRALIEIAIGYGLIMAVIWTPRPLQRYLWLVAVAAIATMTCLSFEGFEAMGLRRKNFFRSLWVVGVAFAISAMAIVVSGEMHALRLPDPPLTGLAHWGGLPPTFVLFVETYWAYAVWTFVQQFLMQCFFLLRLLRLLPGPKSAAFAAAVLFALAHLPNPILAPVTLIWGFAACLIFLRYRNLYPLGMAHAIFGVTIAITIPGPVVHNMRVGLGYLTYGHRHRPTHSFQP
jgi:membrane protease YdiL (CAAX protease family)